MTLAAGLVPGGRREGSRWVAGSIAGGPGRSFQMRISGAGAGRWTEYAGGEHGDALDLVRVALCNGDVVAAMRWAESWLGLSPSGPAPTLKRAPPPTPQQQAAAEEKDRRRAAWLRRQAIEIFDEAQPLLKGTPAEAYLRARGIELAALGRQPRALRFHPACHCSETKTKLPAMVAAIVTAEGQHLATHRTYLAEIGGVWRKAQLSDAKLSIGALRGGFIPLWRGSSGATMAEAPQGERVVIAEGIETALSCALLAPEYRTIASVSGWNLRNLVLPPAITTITIAADNDKPGSPAHRGLEAAIDRFVAEGRAVFVARSPAGKDFNDAIAEVAA
ncbi:MAG: toprim domain-containing protein [Acetobacteraceae bacterium]|nr:toprim domain-containing protein [Acetobacteraceae bacterium]